MKALAALLLLLGGCETVRPCRAQTLLVTITLDATSAPSDMIEVVVTLDGVPSKVNAFGHVPGDPRGTVELDFPSGYPAHQIAEIVVLALAGSDQLGKGAGAIDLPDECGALQVDVHGGP